MTRELMDLLRQASMLVADIRLVAEVTGSLHPMDQARLRNVQRDLISIREHATTPVFMDQQDTG